MTFVLASKNLFTLTKKIAFKESVAASIDMAGIGAADIVITRFVLRCC